MAPRYAANMPARNSREPFEPDPVIEAYKAHVDRTLLRQNLTRTPEQRLLALMELQRFAEELRRAGRSATSARRD
jgi:hypothetical protein